MRAPRNQLLALAGLLLALAGCFEPPVVELLTLTFAPDGQVVAALEVALASPSDLEMRGVARRIEERQRALLDGTDPWLGRFAALEAAEDGTEWRRGAGRLRTFRRWARLEDAAGLDALLRDDAVLVHFDRTGERALLEILPTGASRAMRRERQRVERELSTWAGAYADYLDAAFALDAYLARNPGRAAICWRAALGAEVEAEELDAEETQLAKALAERMTAALDVLQVDAADGFSIDERSRQVFHPLSARVGVELPWEAEEVEGFVRADEHAYVVPELSLWEAATRLEGRWLAVDPLRALAASLRAGGDEEVDVEPFTQLPLATSTTPPTASEVLAGLRRELAPPPAYRLAWRLEADRASAESPE